MKNKMVALLLVTLLILLPLTAWAQELPAGAKGEKVIIWAQNTPIKEWVERTCADFNVEVVVVPTNEYERKIKIALSGGEAPDIISIDQPNIASYADGGALEPLQGYWDKADLAKYPEHQITAASYNGSIYAIPIREANRVLVYNVKMLADAGIEVPKTVEDAWSFEEILGIAEKLTVKQGDVTEVYGFMPCQGTPDQVGEGRTYDFLMYLRSAGGDMASPDLSTASGYFDNEGARKAFQLMADLHAKGYAPLQAVPDGFGTGKIAMQMAGPMDFYTFKNFDVEFDYAPLVTDQKYVCGTGSWWLSITAQSQNKQAAWDLLAHMTQDETLVQYNDLERSLPTKMGLETEAMRTMPPIKFMAETSQKYGVPRAISPKYPQLSEAVYNALNAVCYGEDVDSVIAKYTAELNKILAK